MVFKRSPFALQKGSFCTPKGVLLHFKRVRFALQKESFCMVKGVLLHPKRSPFAGRWFYYGFSI